MSLLVGAQGGGRHHRTNGADSIQGQAGDATQRRDEEKAVRRHRTDWRPSGHLDMREVMIDLIVLRAGGDVG